uniref:OmpA n=1 Tax=Rhodococcus sp. NS1 TaxID=402236 RepID=Q06G95_9NOCA|nr:OmpA [Rhodococcus sp. NS1]
MIGSTQGSGTGRIGARGPRRRGAVAVLIGVVIAALVLLVTGCSSGTGIAEVSPEIEARAEQIDADAVVVVSGAHANTPAPVLTPLAVAVTTDVLEAGGAVSVVTVSGTPVVHTDLDVDPPKSSETDAGRDARVRRGVKQVSETMSVPAEHAGADLLEAISLAAESVRAGGATRPVIVVADSGLSDTGWWDMTVPGMLGADPQQIVDHLRAGSALPDLPGVTVVLSGIGYTAAPQTPLDAPRRGRLTGQWEQVLTAAGAVVQVDSTPSTALPVQTEQPVETVTVPPAPQIPVDCTRASLVFDSQSQVAFEPNEPVLIDEAAARAALGPVISWLTADPARRAVLRGTTADDGTKIYREQLGLRRAEVVFALLIAGGVSPEQLHAVGVGSDFPEFVPDRGPDGQLLPGPAALNRSIRVDLDPAGSSCS